MVATLLTDTVFIPISSRLGHCLGWLIVESADQAAGGLLGQRPSVRFGISLPWMTIAPHQVQGQKVIGAQRKIDAWPGTFDSNFF
jgi:hypothetical protein